MFDLDFSDMKIDGISFADDIAYYKNEGQAEAAARIRAFASGKWGKRQGSLNFERGGYF